MSTRCNIHFNNGETVYANIYRHSDGYPGEVVNGKMVEYGVLSDLLDFFRTLKAEVPDNRMDQAEHLGAKFLVWQSQELAKYGRRYLKEGHPEADEEGRGPVHPLQFLGISPCIRDHCDIEFVYEIECDLRDAEGLPAVRWSAATACPAEENPEVWETVYLGGNPKAA